MNALARIAVLVTERHGRGWSTPSREAAVKRSAADGPQPRPVFRSGVDIDAVHYRYGKQPTKAP